MKYILGTILVILGLSLACMFFPLLIGIFVAIMKFDSGNIFGGIVAIIIGLAVQAFFFFCISSDGGNSSGYSEDDYECPYCGSGDTDGNHCYTCEDDF